jgi:hypothetical protein
LLPAFKIFTILLQFIQKRHFDAFFIIVSSIIQRQNGVGLSLAGSFKFCESQVFKGM